MQELFTYLNSYYWDSIQERNTLADLTSPEDWIASIIHFCNYAFERQGSPAVYREAAKEVFKLHRSWLEDRVRWSNDIETRLFDTFTELCRNSLVENLNLKNNPMRPSEGDLISIICFAWYETDQDSITGWTLSSIENDNLLNSFNILRKIRGVRKKISSFYLRDIYILSGRHDRSIRNRYLLQPIDVRTRRAARILSDHEHASDRSYAEILIGLEDEMELVTGSSNIAFWVLGSQIAEDEKTFTKYVQAIRDRDEDMLNSLLNSKISEEKDRLEFLQALSTNLKS